MKKKFRSGGVIAVLIILLLGAVFVFLMNYAFEHSEGLRDLFSASSETKKAFGEVPTDSPNSIEAQSRLTAKISMYIFSVITVLQFVAFAVAAAVVSSIKSNGQSPAVQVKDLENAEIFFDVPLYVGLFGTISAFLVMTFSPQSSRLIAYSSTLIGIIFSLVLRLTLQYPLRKRLNRAVEGVTESTGKSR